MTGSGNDSTASGAYTRLGLLVALAGFVLDQLNKWWLINPFAIATRAKITLAPFLDVVFSLNRGISFSFLTQGDPRGQYALALFALVASVLMVWWLATNVATKLGAVGLGLVLGGALGNGLDRLTRGGVADFYSLHLFGFQFFVFNLADVEIFVGVVILLYQMLGELVGSDDPNAADADATK